MNVGMVAFVMKGSVPFQIFHGDFEVLCNRFRLSPKHIPPTFTFIESETLRVLTAKRNDHGPHVAVVFIQFFGYFFKIYTYSVVSEQTVRTEPFRAGTGRYVVRVCFCIESFVRVVLKRAAYELRRVAESWLADIVFVLRHIFAVGKVTENFSDHFFLLFRRRIISESVVDPVCSFTGGNIFCVTAGAVSCGRLQVFELGNKFCHRLVLLPFESIL